MDDDINTEMSRISQRLNQRIKELAERYETTLNEQIGSQMILDKKVNGHLKKMGYL